ncbi:hypothetical protein BJ741DRAFT_653860 [Chytriomyces cf. hyalinus JEL632]|nr:hypothetical protein BJ741DRAFT_653860 [Chytriomyces cf. hyalinus JEL632]
MSQPPHLPHTASSASSELDLNKQNRQHVSAIIHTNAVALQLTLFNMFSKLNLGATIGPRNATSTPVLFEGPSALVNRAKEALQIVLTDELVESPGPLSKVTLIETVQLKQQPFSGESKEADLADLAGLSVGLCDNRAGYIKEKRINVMYKRVCHTIEISTKTTYDLHAAIHQKFDLNAAIRCLFRFDVDGTRAFATEIGEFQDGMKYYLRTELDHDEVHNGRLHEKLKMDEDMSEEQVKEAKRVFSEQGITLKQLIVVGKFAILTRIWHCARKIEDGHPVYNQIEFGLKFHDA